ncbi:hypothetical protein BV900_24425 [Agrobacterium tumefaciens]|nr:hypothetical protein BV900_24425 [Agrobacterium tumefaciens]
MQFVLVIPPKSATGDETYYFWVLQKWLHETRGHATSIIMPCEYIPAMKDPSRWEFSQQSFNFNQYLPSTQIDENTEIILQTVGGSEDGSSPMADFVDLIIKQDPALTDFYAQNLRAIKKKTKEDLVVVTWLNNSSLRLAAKRENCPIVFNELGPFRKPFYRQTAYWDRHGVNGETEVADRWQQEKEDFSSWRKRAYPQGGSAHDLRIIFADPVSHLTLKEAKRRAEVGIALQVETDSNALAYGNGWNNLALINYMKRSDIAKRALLRLHPGGAAIYSGQLDLSPSPLEFLASVDQIWTVNSSLGIEALFWGKGARIFGDSPIKLITTLDAEDAEVFLEWFLLCYLVPFDLLFDLQYYSWRLGDPSASEIAKRHLIGYRSGAKQPWEKVPFPPKPDENKIVVSFPSPRRAPIELAEQKLDLVRHREYIAKLEKDISELHGLSDERNTLILERDALIDEHRSITTEKDHLTNELKAIKSSLPFRFLKLVRLI